MCNIKLNFKLLFILCFSVVLGSCSGSNGTYEFSALYENLPFEMSEASRPDIPSKTVYLNDFGAVGDGIRLNTEAFAKAVDALAEQGGGHLVVPDGLWLTGPVTLKSNIDLHLSDNAVILFDDNIDLYPIIDTDFEGLRTKRCESPINADGQKNISITGKGVIDGNGYSWRPLKKSKVTGAQWKEKIAQGGYVDTEKNIWYPDEAYLKGMAVSDRNLNVPVGEFGDEFWAEIKSFLRPVMVSLRRCENVLLEGVTFQNSPAWNIHPLLCNNVIIKDVIVRNPAYSQNGDGLDIDACNGVIVTGSSFDVGDDAICIKSGKDEDGRNRGIPCRNVIVDNCIVYHGHGGFVVGSEMSGGVENIKVSNCRFLGTDVGLRFKSRRGRGGVVKNIYISDIYMKDIVTETLLFDLFYSGMSAVEAKAAASGQSIVGLYEADGTTPEFRDIYIRNIVCNGCDRAMYFNGLPEMPVRNVNIENCVIKSRSGIEIRYSEDVTMRNVKVIPEAGEAVTVSNSKNVEVE